MVKYYEIFTTFGLSAVLSFVVSVTLLLIILAAKRGVFRVGASTKVAKHHSPLLVPDIPPLVPKVIEMTPLQDPAN